MILMNRLSISKRAQILQMLVEGNSLRATSRMADVAYNSVLKMVSDAISKGFLIAGHMISESCHMIL